MLVLIVANDDQRIKARVRYRAFKTLDMGGAEARALGQNVRRDLLRDGGIGGGDQFSERARIALAIKQFAPARVNLGVLWIILGRAVKERRMGAANSKNKFRHAHPSRTIAECLRAP